MTYDRVPFSFQYFTLAEDRGGNDGAREGRGWRGTQKMEKRRVHEMLQINGDRHVGRSVETSGRRKSCRGGARGDEGSGPMVVNK